MANTYTWTGDVNNDWINSLNWDIEFGFPGSTSTDTALITLAGAAPTIGADDGFITLSDIDLDAVSGTLTVANETVNTETLLALQGTVSIAAGGIINLGSAAGPVKVGGQSTSLARCKISETPTVSTSTGRSSYPDPLHYLILARRRPPRRCTREYQSFPAER